MIQFDYNHYDQVIEERWYTSGMSLVRTLEFTFDDAGQLTEATDPAATLGFTYDAAVPDSQTEKIFSTRGIKGCLGASIH